MNWLDFKLGGRMLVKYPGLTVVGGIAMAFAIWVGLVIFQFLGSVHPPDAAAAERRPPGRNSPHGPRGER